VTHSEIDPGQISARRSGFCLWDVAPSAGRARRPDSLPILPNKPANFRVWWPPRASRGPSFFFRSKLVLLKRSDRLLSNIGGQPAYALHSDIPCATKSHRRAAELHSQPSTQTGRDWPVNATYRCLQGRLPLHRMTVSVATFRVPTTRPQRKRLPFLPSPFRSRSPK
jgi:hypothetical protein